VALWGPYGVFTHTDLTRPNGRLPIELQKRSTSKSPSESWGLPRPPAPGWEASCLPGQPAFPYLLPSALTMTGIGLRQPNKSPLMPELHTYLLSSSDEPWNLMLRERSQSQRITYCVVPFLCNVQNRQVHRHRSRVVNVRTSWTVEWEVSALGQK
jgi:hypothetical protein